MASSPIEKQLYPFSTDDSKAIPLDIIRPLAMVKRSFLAAGTVPLTIPAGWKVASFFSSVGCFVQFAAATIPNPPVDDAVYADTLFVPPNCVVTSTVVEGVATVIPMSEVVGSVIVQNIQKWAGLALARQVSKT